MLRYLLREVPWSSARITFSQVLVGLDYLPRVSHQSGSITCVPPLFIVGRDMLGIINADRGLFSEVILLVSGSPIPYFTGHYQIYTASFLYTFAFFHLFSQGSIEASHAARHRAMVCRGQCVAKIKRSPTSLFLISRRGRLALGRGRHFLHACHRNDCWVHREHLHAVHYAPSVDF